MQSYEITKLETAHIRSRFCCGVDELDKYLKQQASQDIKRNLAAVYVFTESSSSTVLGYYTLSSTIIPLDELPEKISSKLPKYPNMPAILLGRLALDKKYQSRGYGEILLINALKRSLSMSRTIGSMAVVVDAKNVRAKSFYEGFGFIPFQDSYSRLFITMKIISKLPL